MEINRKVLASIFVISILTFSLGYGTMSYFSDVEKSTGNTFTAGTLDLTVNGTSNPTAFFTIGDVKPGDKGEKIITLHVTNDAWARVIITMTKNDDVSSNEPELEVDILEDPLNDFDGELAANLELRFLWKVGDEYVDMLGASRTPPASELWVTLSQILGWPSYGEEDGPHSSWFELPGLTQPLGSEPLIGCTTYYLKVMWRVPSAVGNIIQSDSVSVDVTFEVSQMKNQAYPWGPQ